MGDPADDGASGASTRFCRPGGPSPKPTAKLSELVRDLHTLVQAPSITDAAWEAHARIHRRATREAIEAARTAVMDTLRARGAASNRAAQAIIRLETADQIFGGLIALSDLLEHSSAAERRIAERILRRMRPVILALGRVVVTDDPDAHRRIDRAIDAIVADQERLPADSPLRCGNRPDNRTASHRPHAGGAGEPDARRRSAGTDASPVATDHASACAPT